MSPTRPLPTDRGRVADPGSGDFSAQALVVHPGTLPVTVYQPLLGLLSPIGAEVVDLASDRAYAHAGLDPRVADPALADLADAVASRAARGPLPVGLLIGWSFGGLVALAAAARLAPVPDVLLLDTVAPIARIDAARAEVPRWFADYLSWRAGRRLRTGASDPASQDLESLFGPALEAGALASDVTAGGFRMLTRAYTAGLERNFRIAGAAVAPRPSHVTLVKPERGLLPDTAANGWESFADDVRVVPCAGDHYSMLTDPGATADIAAEVGRVAGQRAR